MSPEAGSAGEGTLWARVGRLDHRRGRARWEQEDKPEQGATEGERRPGWHRRRTEDRSLWLWAAPIPPETPLHPLKHGHWWGD